MWERNAKSTGKPVFHNVGKSLIWGITECHVKACNLWGMFQFKQWRKRQAVIVGVQSLINSNISFNLSLMDCVNSSLRVEQEDRRQCLACFSNSFVGGHQQQQQRIDCWFLHYLKSLAVTHRLTTRYRRRSLICDDELRTRQSRLFHDYPHNPQ